MQIKILNDLTKIDKARLLKRLKKQKNALMVLFITAAVLSVYSLTHDTNRRMGAEAHYWEAQSRMAQSLLPLAGSEQGVIDLINEVQGRYREVALDQGRDVLQLIKDYAQRMDIYIVSIPSDIKQAMKSKRSTFISNSRNVQTFTISMEVRAEYMNLMRYFDTLYRFSPVCLSVDKLKISRNEASPDKLKAVMELRFYMYNDNNKADKKR